MKKIFFILIFILSLSFYRLTLAENTKFDDVKQASSSIIEKIPFKDKIKKIFEKSEEFRKDNLFYFLAQKDKEQNKIFLFEEKISAQNLEENKREIKNALVYVKYYYYAFITFILSNIYVYYILILLVLFRIFYFFWRKIKER